MIAQGRRQNNICAGADDEDGRKEPRPIIQIHFDCQSMKCDDRYCYAAEPAHRCQNHTDNRQVYFPREFVDTVSEPSLGGRMYIDSMDGMNRELWGPNFMAT